MADTKTSGAARPNGVVLISVWFIICAAIALISAAAVAILAFPAVLLETRGTDERYFAVAGLSFGLFLLGIFGVFEVAAVVGLLRLQNWGRMIAIVLAALGLILFPFGTLAGIFIIWYLLTDTAKRAFGAAAPPPPPPEPVEAAPSAST